MYTNEGEASLFFIIIPDTEKVITTETVSGQTANFSFDCKSMKDIIKYEYKITITYLALVGVMVIL